MEKDGMSMAWKEPGDSNKKDPHGKRRDPWGNKNDGPPDLDKVFQDFNKKLKKIFGGGGGSGSGGGSSEGGSGFGNLLGFGLGFGAVLLIVVIIYVVIGFYIVDPAEQAVVTRFGKYNRTVGQGPHWSPRFIEEKTVINTEKIRTSSHMGTMLTKDENIVDVAMEVQYRINDVENYMFAVKEPDRTLRLAADSALRQVVGNADLEFVITTGKAQIAERMKQQLQIILERYDMGIYVATVAFKEAKPPKAVKEAFDAVTKSREEREQLKHQAETYANKILPEARGQAKQMRVAASAYKDSVILAAEGEAKRFNAILPEYKKAPIVIKEHLYLDTMEKVFTKTSKIFVDVNSGNNLIYLPIDKLMKANNIKKINVPELPKEELQNSSDNNNNEPPTRYRDPRRRTRS